MKKTLYFIFITVILSCCGSVETDVQLFQKGKSFTEQKNIPEAVSAYENLIKEYPESPFADSTLFNIAGFYQNKLLKNLTEEQSLKKAAEYFYRIYEDHPESPLAPTGLFMCGFIQANELYDYDAATKTYNLFIEKFPDNELAASARKEVENMGLSPEDYLKNNIAKENGK